MKKGFIFGIAVIGFSIMLSTGCSELPQEEIDAAKAAVELAKSAGADVYVADSFAVLQDSLNSVMVELEAQNSKLLKSYGPLKEQLAAVTLYAGEVKTMAENRIVELKSEIDSAIIEIAVLNEKSRKLILEAPRGKEGAAALTAIKGEIEGVETAVNETTVLLEYGEVLAASNKVNAAREKAEQIANELTEVIAKYKSSARGGR